MTAFLADENFPAPVIKALVALGRDVEAMPEALRGEADTDLLARAAHAHRVLLTQDKDFAALVAAGAPSYGLVLLRLPTKGGWKARARNLAKRIDALSATLAGAMTIVFEDQVERIDLR